MTQKRIYNYGANVYSQDDNETRQYLLVPGVYSSFTFSVDASGDLELAAGVGLQPDGVMWQEDDTTTLSFTPPGAPTNYTVVATTVDVTITGGAPVEYAIQTGLTATVTGGVVLGWIYHTGGGAVLTSSMLVEAPKALSDQAAQLAVDTAPLDLLAPLPRTYSDTSGAGANITFTGQMADTLQFDATYFVNHQRVEKAAGPAGAETITQYVQFFMGDHRPVGFDFYLNMPGAAQLQLELRDTDLNIVTITGSPITGATTNWEWQSIEVDRNSGTFTSGEPYQLRLTHSVDVGQRIDLAIVRARFYPYPT